jgi:hypothetical protein
MFRSAKPSSTGWSCRECGQNFGTELDFSQHHLSHDVDGTRQKAFSRFVTDAIQTLLGLNRFWEIFESMSADVSYDAATLLEIMQAVSRTFRGLDVAERKPQWLDASPPSHTQRRKVASAMMRLAASSKELPPSLYVHGVELGAVRDPLSQGGFADVFKAGYRGGFVALKRLRSYRIGEPDLYKVPTLLSSAVHLLSRVL